MNPTQRRVKFQDPAGDALIVGYDNCASPYRQGVSLELEDHRGGASQHVFLEMREGEELRDVLIELFPLPVRTP